MPTPKQVPLEENPPMGNGMTEKEAVLTEENEKLKAKIAQLEAELTSWKNIAFQNWNVISVIRKSSDLGVVVQNGK